MNPVDLKGLHFTLCSAEYGGGVYIYSSSRKNKVWIDRCSFDNNIATIADGNNGFCGGSSMFLMTRKASVRNCDIKDDSVKIFNNFGSSSRSVKLINEIDDSISISNCKFTINQNSQYSLFYLGGNHANPLKLENCIFEGKLENGVHFIDGELLNKNSPKMIIKSCKFDDKLNSYKSNYKDFVSSKLISHIVNYDSKKLENNNNLLISVSSLFAVVVVLMTIIIIGKKKKNNNYSDDQDELDDESSSYLTNQVSI